MFLTDIEGFWGAIKTREFDQWSNYLKDQVGEASTASRTRLELSLICYCSAAAWELNIDA